MAKILAIDPGTSESAYVVYDTYLTTLTDQREKRNMRDFGIYSNEYMLSIVQTVSVDCLAIEMIASYGMAVGKTVFETCVWIGRMAQQFRTTQKKPFHFVYRTDVKMHLCNSTRAKDSNIRQAILDLYPETGGGKTPQVGTKAQPGPLYGVSKDVWSALAVAITFAETHNES